MDSNTIIKLFNTNNFIIKIQIIAMNITITVLPKLDNYNVNKMLTSS